MSLIVQTKNHIDEVPNFPLMNSKIYCSKGFFEQLLVFSFHDLFVVELFLGFGIT